MGFESMAFELALECSNQVSYEDPLHWEQAK